MRFFILFWCILGLLIPSVYAADEHDRFRKGLELADEGEIEEAIQELQGAVQDGEAHADVYLALGILSEKAERDFQALEALLNAQKLNPSLASIPFALALLYEKLDLPEKAIGSWKKFIALTGNKKLIKLAKKHIYFLENK